jgi:hypothetical protein
MQDFCHCPFERFECYVRPASWLLGTFDAPHAKLYGAAMPLPHLFVRPCWSKTMAREELKWQNINADDLPAEVKKSFDAMVEAEAAFKADLEKLLKNEGHLPEDKFLVMSRKGKRIGVAYASTPRGEGGAGSLKFKTK